MSEHTKIEKDRFPRAIAIEVARELCAALEAVTLRRVVAGSLRRRKPEVGDVEILYIPLLGLFAPPSEIFPRQRNLADLAILELERRFVLERRTNAKGLTMFGPLNKLMRHCETGVPVDLFAATEANWWNYLVCRTGPAESNTRIAAAARRAGWKWNPYRAGFSRGGALAGEIEERVMQSEREVFEFAGLPYEEPWERDGGGDLCRTAPPLNSGTMT